MIPLSLLGPRALARAGVCGVLALLVISTAVPAGAVDRAALNRWLALDYALPRYAALAERATALRRSAEAFCTLPDAKGLVQLRADFDGAMDAWMSVQHLRLGPIMTAQRLERLYFWPDKHNTANRQYAAALAKQDPALIAMVAKGEGSVALQGLPALERLLYSDEVPLVSDDSDAAYRCDLIVAIAGNVATIATDTQKEWGDESGGFAKMVLEAGQANASFADARDASAAFLNSFLAMFEVVSDLKLARPLGNDAASARARLAESWRSGRSLRNITLNLEALRAMYDGGGAGEPGLAAALADTLDGTVAAALIKDHFDAAMTAVRAVSLPFDQAIAEPSEREKLVRLLSEIRDVKRLAAAHLPGALDVAVGFNSLDGD